MEPGDSPAVAAAQLRTSHASVVTVENGSGTARTINVSGGPVVDRASPFFQSLGTNGRSCATCHDVRDNMTVTPARLRERFAATGGTDPIFRTVDGPNSPDADVSTVRARRTAYGMLLTKGLIRVGLGIRPAPSSSSLGSRIRTAMPAPRSCPSSAVPCPRRTSSSSPLSCGTAARR